MYVINRWLIYDLRHILTGPNYYNTVIISLSLPLLLTTPRGRRVPTF